MKAFICLLATLVLATFTQVSELFLYPTAIAAVLAVCFTIGAFINYLGRHSF